MMMVRSAPMTTPRIPAPGPTGSWRSSISHSAPMPRIDNIPPIGAQNTVVSLSAPKMLHNTAVSIVKMNAEAKREMFPFDKNFSFMIYSYV